MLSSSAGNCLYKIERAAHQRVGDLQAAPRVRGSGRRANGYLLQLTCTRKFLEREFADRFEHAKTTAAPVPQETLGDELLDRVKARLANGLRRFDTELAGETPRARNTRCSSSDRSS